jgi:hypothetical protein
MIFPQRQLITHLNTNKLTLVIIEINKIMGPMKIKWKIRNITSKTNNRKLNLKKINISILKIEI